MKRVFVNLHSNTFTARDVNQAIRFPRARKTTIAVMTHTHTHTHTRVKAAEL